MCVANLEPLLSLDKFALSSGRHTDEQRYEALRARENGRHRESGSRAVVCYDEALAPPSKQHAPPPQQPAFILYPDTIHHSRHIPSGFTQRPERQHRMISLDWWPAATSATTNSFLGLTLATKTATAANDIIFYSIRSGGDEHFCFHSVWSSTVADDTVGFIFAFRFLRPSAPTGTPTAERSIGLILLLRSQRRQAASFLHPIFRPSSTAMAMPAVLRKQCFSSLAITSFFLLHAFRMGCRLKKSHLASILFCCYYYASACEYKCLRPCDCSSRWLEVLKETNMK